MEHLNTEHYFSENPKSSFRKEKFEVDILDEHIIINSGSGLFSLKELDFGTELLITNAKIDKDGSRILDLGCGYGIVGIALKKHRPKLDITMVDVNDRAVRTAKQNCDENNVACKVFKSDIYSNVELADKKFDIVLTNPPFSAGKSVCIEFIEQSFEHLNDTGSLQLVAPHNKGGESLKKIMKEKFGNVEELCKKRGYRVYYSMKV
jgi:16S rRNA (guanine1207-N2)-methyltransferase